MTPERRDHLLRVVATVGSLDEMGGVRRQLAHQQELVGEVYTAMQRRVDELAARERISPTHWWRRRA